MMITAINLFNYLAAGTILWFIFYGSFYIAMQWNDSFKGEKYSRIRKPVEYVFYAIGICSFLLLCVVVGGAFMCVFTFAFRIS